MNRRTWMVAAGSVLLLTIGIASCTAWIAGEPPKVLDSAGLTEEEVARLGVREQYALVGDRYQELNDLVTKTQLQLYTGDWIATGTGTSYMTLRGSALSGALAGQATASNSYYLAQAWRLGHLPNSKAKLDEIKDAWVLQGWEATKVESDVTPGEFSVIGRSPEGPWVSVDILGDGIVIRAHSGVYWGDRDALAVAIWNIQQTERNEGVQWRPTKVNAEGHGLIRPGEYPPFPEWRSVALEERLEKSSRGAE